jgi:hypothetical protein
VDMEKKGSSRTCFEQNRGEESGPGLKRKKVSSVHEGAGSRKGKKL